MSFIKGIFELVLITIILFFVWNILKRIFFKQFYKYRFPRSEEENKTNDSQKNIKKNVKWDAETVDFEEIKETKNEK